MVKSYLKSNYIPLPRACLNRECECEKHITTKPFATENPHLKGTIWFNKDKTFTECDTVIVTFHGARESSKIFECNRLAMHAGRVNQENIIVISLDYGNHAKKNQHIFHVSNPKALADSIPSTLEKIQQIFCPGRKIAKVIGHSYGGLLLCAMASNPIHKKILDSCVEEFIPISPFIGYGPQILKHQYLLTIMQKCHRTSTRFPLFFPRNLHKYKNPVLRCLFKKHSFRSLSTSTFLGARDLIDNEVNAQTAKRLKARWTILHSQDDPITACDSSEKFSKKMGEKCTLFKIEGKHDHLRNLTQVFIKDSEGRKELVKSITPDEYWPHAHHLLNSGVGNTMMDILLNPTYEDTDA